MLTIKITLANAEHSHVSEVKTSLRSSTHRERLPDSALLAIE